MKKYLSLILAVMMVLSCVSYAAPVAVGTVSSADEAEVEVSELFEADLAEETEEPEATVTTDLAFETHVIGISFDKLTEWKNDSLVSTIADVYNIPAQFPEGVAFKLGISSGAGSIVAKEEGSTDMVLHCTPTSGYSRWYLQTTSTAKILPNGTYRVSLEMKKDSTVVKNPNTNIYGVKGTNYPIIDAGIKATNTFATFETSFVYERGVTGKWYDTDKNANTGEDGKEHFATDAIGFQTYMNSEQVTWDVDNINIYYMPEYVNVDFNGYGKIPADIKVLKNGNFVPSEFAPATLPDAAEEFLGWSLTEGGEVLADAFVVTADTTLYAVYKNDVKTMSQYGNLAYFVDFDVASDTAVKALGTGTSISDLTVVMAPALEGMPTDVRIESYTKNYYTDGDNLIVKNDGKYPRWFMTAYKDDNKLSTYPKGKYTLEWCSTTTDSNATTNSFVINGTDTTLWKTSNLGSVKSTTKNKVNEYNVFVGTVVYDGAYAYKEDGSKVYWGTNTEQTDLSGGLARIGVYCQSDNAQSADRKYKWAKLWYAPLTVKLSFDANGKDVDVPETKEVDSTVKFADYKLADCGTSRFVGWSETKDGKIITDATKIYGEDTTLYAIWDDGYSAPENEELNVGKLFAHLHFNNIGIGTSLNSQMVNYGTVNKEFVVSHSSGYTYPDIIYSDATNNEHIDEHPANIWFGADSAKYLYTDEEGSIKYADNAVVFKAVKPEAVTRFYPKLKLVNNERGTFRDGVYTFVAQVTVEDDENIDKVGYTAFANGVATELKYINAGESTYIKASMLVLDGALYDYETMNKTAALGSKITNVGFNFDFKMKEAVLESPEITADNFRIYYKPYDAAPKSYSENSIRVAAPAGIRFRASVTSIERENEKLTEYGFIVTLDKLLKNASVDKNNFTHESNVTKVEGKNYDKANNVDKIFETQGNYSFFTAVVHNIPANQYKENIVVRPYVVIDGEYVYGDAMERNIYDVAQQIKEKNGADYATYKDAIDNILAEKAI